MLEYVRQVHGLSITFDCQLQKLLQLLTYVQVRGDLFIVVILFIVFLLLYFAFVLFEVVDTSTLEEAALQANTRTRTALDVLIWKWITVLQA